MEKTRKEIVGNNARTNDRKKELRMKQNIEIEIESEISSSHHPLQITETRKNENMKTRNIPKIRKL